MATPQPNNARLGRPCGLTCLQGNMRRSKPSLLTLLVDAANKKTHPNGLNIIFLTEPPTIRETNKLLNVPGDIYNVFVERGGRAALITTGINSWWCPQYCSKDIIVCQTKINDRLTYLIREVKNKNNKTFWWTKSTLAQKPPLPPTNVDYVFVLLYPLASS